MPFLIAAELVVHRRMRFVVRQFLDRHLIPESAMTRFDVAIASLFRRRNSVLAEVLLFAAVYVVGILVVSLVPDRAAGTPPDIAAEQAALETDLIPQPNLR